MSYQDNPDKWGMWLLAAMLAIVGILILVFPEALSDLDDSGRRALLKMLIKKAWSYPGGVIALLAAAFVTYRAIRSE